MSVRFLLLALLTVLCLPARADPNNFSIEEAMDHPDVKSALRPGIKVVWGAQKVEDEIERAKPDTYTGNDYGVSFANKKKRCMDIFASAMQDMIRDALLREYDVIDVQGLYKGKPPQDLSTYVCDIGFRGIDVVLNVTFIQTRAGAANLEKIRNDPMQLAAIRGRKLSPDTLLLPLGPMLESPEASTILRGIKVHWGYAGAPAFVERFGPDTYEEDASISKYGREEACRKAVLSALESMANDARERKFNGLVMIRSYYERSWAPDDQQVECYVGGRSAKIQLVGTQVRLK